MLMIILDVTIVNVALPAIQGELGFSRTGLAWVVNAYLIPFGSLLLLAGRLGDLVSRRGVFVSGLIVFTLASALCGLASSREMLIAARFLQGVGGAATSAVILGMIVTMFPEAREQARAIGVYSFVASAGGAVGLLLGGVLTSAVNWHWIFFVNVPVGVCTIAAARRLIPADRGPGLRQGADVLGAVLITGALMVTVYTVVTPGGSLPLALLALGLGVAFVAREATAAAPLVPLRIFRQGETARANLAQLLSAAGMFGMFFVGVLYCQHVLGYDAMQIGLAFLPVTVVMGGLSLRYTERLIGRFGARKLVLTGLGLVVAGLAYFARVPSDGSYLVDVLPAMLVLGAGGGLAFPALAALAMSSATPDDAGLASGVFSTTAEVGSALGLAVLATLSAGGYRLPFIAAAVMVAAGLAVLVKRPATVAVEKELVTA
ncbi:MFS transporter [Actinoplanes subtropicus]|uniref:MFS transporter n=1 Tax=Actinoplanes subtropicus TaxID=543632 RepID=UPI002480A283|nr:MFS transporter [Actinoplanes subtropicus]